MIVETSGLADVAAAFARAHAQGRGAFVPYLCAGDPDRATSGALFAALAASGADLIEAGIPYGDPLADGPTISAAAQRALAAGTTPRVALALAAAARAAGPPVLAFTYVNPVAQFGFEAFAEALVAGGICGAIVPDLPLEESGALGAAFAARGLVLPMLIAPTTPPARAAALARASTGFVYLVSRLGVTSAKREPDFAWIAGRVRDLRAVTELPLLVGFGISRPEQVAQTVAIADGAIVGSALIDAFAGTHGSEAVARLEARARALQAATIRTR